MNNINSNLKTALGIRGRLLMGFSLIIAILLIASGAVLWQIISTKNIITFMSTTEIPAYTALGDFYREVIQAGASIRGYLLNQDPVHKSQNAASHDNMLRLISELDPVSKNWSIEDQQ